MQEVHAVRSPCLSKLGDDRYVIVDAETGEIIDDAQGYGYKSPQKAHASWSYKANKGKRKSEAKKQNKVRKWMKQHKGFVDQMNGFAFEIECKHSWGPEDHFDAAFVQQMLNDRDLYPDFTAAELLKEWRK